MQIIINSNSQVLMDQESIEQHEAEIAAELDRFKERLTRIEVHLTDENSLAKGGDDDIRCLMEARPAGQQPVGVEVRAATVEQALREGADTLKRRLSTMFEKARTEQRRPR
ncbi:HPF/RaiA family ribosome-associated protein [Botrimarina sp.]|uniref:HPF/RaiA family ribosome-associated protein n=1 Tax=Botrimarina sp. TaxID=2795802 RepID=UPI0032EF32EE